MELACSPPSDAEAMQMLMRSSSRIEPGSSDSTTILQLCNSINQLHDKMDYILQNNVGWNRCSELRDTCHKENTEKFRDLFDRVKCIEEKSTTLAVRAEENVKHSELTEVYNEQKIVDAVFARIKTNVFDFSWCSFKSAFQKSWLVKLVAAFYVLNVAGDFGVWLGRYYDFYPWIHRVLFGV
jgi:hypothetical protein